MCLFCQCHCFESPILDVLLTHNKNHFYFLGGDNMNVRQRVLALRLLEKQKRNPEYAKRLGVETAVSKNTAKKKQE